MRIVFCDDDESVMLKLERYLRTFFSESGLKQPEYAAYLCGEDLLESTERVDIAFLDVEMPGYSGIKVGAKLKQRYPYAKVFILTSYPDYLDEAMKFHVFRYLSKPLDKNRLYRNMKEALFQISIDTKPILIETVNDCVTRYADEVIMVEANKHKVRIHTVDQVYESIQPMKYWENTLLEIGSFFQTHRSYIVNMKFVRSFDEAMIRLKLPSNPDFSAYLARRRYVAFKNTYIRYLEAIK